MKFKNCLICIFIISLVLLTGCTTFIDIISKPPEEAKENLDALCDASTGGATGSVVDFYAGGYQGWFLTDWKNRLSVQQLQDYNGFMLFCDKPVAERTMTEYGYWTATKYRTLDSIIPFKSVTRAAKKVVK